MALLTVEELREMAAYIDEKMNYRQVGEGRYTWDCDKTMRHTTDWLKAHYKSLEDNLEELGEQGAYCDCEVLLNVRIWPEIIGDTVIDRNVWDDDPATN